MKKILLDFIVTLGALALLTLAWVFIFKRISVQSFAMLFMISVLSMLMRALYTKVPRLILFSVYTIFLVLFAIVAILHL
ncbi:hypothetical protein [Lactococcus garvieae]|uniref:hypothetical protein n=1 Tax=Lactococcus garvieae TaxID=1363 RepID=UPI0018D99021|nr:hypothetical protein [Lactococcus garvieae]QPS70301.1 hypothetical protein I6G50_05815 [Lactococcus garvieae]